VFTQPLIERLQPQAYPPLAINRIDQENSITVGFGPSLSIRTSKDGVELILPRWSAALVLVGAALTFGFDRYEQFLHTRNDLLEYRKLSVEVAQLAEASPRTKRRVNYQVRQVQDALAFPTVRSATVNGIPLR
jgi:hypothetical protein